MSKQKTIAIIDGYNLIYRLFFAVPEITLQDGTPVNAVFGLARVLISLYTEDRPDFLIFVLDSKTNFRRDIYAQYKATRERMPDNLRSQEMIMRELLEAFDITPLQVEGFEADDIIGTLAESLKTNPDHLVNIYSVDKDLYQFVDNNVKMVDTMKKRIMGSEETREKFGVDAKHIVDWLSICGDSSDNIPGIYGFGPKKAESLINAYGTLENIYEHLEELTGKTKDTLIQYKDQAFLSKQLATICTHVPLADFSLGENAFAGQAFFTPKAIDWLQKYRFNSLLPKEHQTRPKNLFPSISTQAVTSDANIQDLLSHMQTQKQLGIATHLQSGTLRFIYIALQNTVYGVDISQLDAHRFISDLLAIIQTNPQITVAGFNIKEDIKILRNYLQNISENVTEGQGRLF